MGWARALAAVERQGHSAAKHNARDSTSKGEGAWTRQGEGSVNGFRDRARKAVQVGRAIAARGGCGLVGATQAERTDAVWTKSREWSGTRLADAVRDRACGRGLGARRSGQGAGVA